MNAVAGRQEGSSSSMNNTEYESKSHSERLGKDTLQGDGDSVLNSHRVRYFDMEETLIVF